MSDCLGGCNTLQILKSLDDPENQLDFPLELDNSSGNGLLNEDKSLKRAATFISLSGAPIRLEANTFVRFANSTDVFGNGQTDGLVFSFTKDAKLYQPYYKYENGVPIFTGYKTLIQSGEQVIKDPYINPIIYEENTLIDEVWFGSVTGSCSIQLFKIKDFIVHSLGDDVSQEVKHDYFSKCKGKYQAISTIWSASVNKIYSFIYTSSGDFELHSIDETSGFEAVKQQHLVPCKIKSITDTKLQSLYNRKAAEYRFEEINGSIKTILVLPYDGDNSLICLTDNEAIVNYYLYNKYQGWYQIDIVASDYAGQLTGLLFNTVKSAAIFAGITAASAIAGQVMIVELGFSVVGGTAVEILTEATLWTIQGNDEEARMALMGGFVGAAVAAILQKVAKKAWTAWRAGKNPKIIHSKPSGNNTPDIETIEELFDRAVRPVDQGGAGLSNAQLTKLQDDFDGKPELITFMFEPGAVKAWKDLFVRNVPDILRTNTKFLSRLSDNPNLVNYIDNLTPAGKTNLANNADEWIKIYDARVPLKNGNVNDAVNVLGGSLGAPYSHIGGNYVKALSAAQETKFNQIINSSTIDANIASNLGLDQSVIQSAKEHMFITEHLVETSSGGFVKGRFDVEFEQAKWWTDVAGGNLDNADDLRKLIAHEFIESKLMQEGIIYSPFTSSSAAKYGAHQLSVHDFLLNFDHWGSVLGRNTPSFSLNPNLSNIDDVVSQIKTIEGL